MRRSARTLLALIPLALYGCGGGDKTPMSQESLSSRNYSQSDYQSETRGVETRPESRPYQDRAKLYSEFKKLVKAYASSQIDSPERKSNKEEANKIRGNLERYVNELYIIDEKDNSKILDTAKNNPKAREAVYLIGAVDSIIDEKVRSLWDNYASQKREEYIKNNQEVPDWLKDVTSFRYKFIEGFNSGDWMKEDKRILEEQMAFDRTGLWPIHENALKEYVLLESGPEAVKKIFGE